MGYATWEGEMRMADVVVDMNQYFRGLRRRRLRLRIWGARILWVLAAVSLVLVLAGSL
jgi:hypothetical protein